MSNSIRVAGIIKESIVDGTGIRYVVFAQGCPHACKGCHNEAALDFSGGYDYEIEKILSEIKINTLFSGVTFSGGEPFCQPKAFLELADELVKKEVNIWVYTGYTYEELLELAKKDEDIKNLMERIDVLVDGRFVLEKRDIALNFKGSANQRCIDMKATAEKNEIVLFE